MVSICRGLLCASQIRLWGWPEGRRAGQRGQLGLGLGLPLHLIHRHNCQRADLGHLQQLRYRPAWNASPQKLRHAGTITQNTISADTQPQ